MLVIKKLIKKKEVRGVSVSVRYYLLKSKGGRGGGKEREVIEGLQLEI
jgi:hypothetical protein